VDSVSKRVIGHARVDVEGVVRWDAPLTKMGDIPLAERLALIVFLSP